MESIITLMLMSVLATSEMHASVTVTAAPLHPISNNFQQTNENQQNKIFENKISKNLKQDPQQVESQENSQTSGISLISATTTQTTPQNSPASQSFDTPNQIQVASLGPSVPETPPEQNLNGFTPQQINGTVNPTAEQPAEKKKIKKPRKKNLTKGQRSLRKKSKNSNN